MGKSLIKHIPSLCEKIGVETNSNYYTRTVEHEKFDSIAVLIKGNSISTWNELKHYNLILPPEAIFFYINFHDKFSFNLILNFHFPVQHVCRQNL
jgi:hypothetical protein